MDYLQLIVLAIGVAMDAFAVSICKGITLKKDLNKIINEKMSKVKFSLASFFLNEILTRTLKR